MQARWSRSGPHLRGSLEARKQRKEITRSQTLQDGQQGTRGESSTGPVPDLYLDASELLLQGQRKELMPPSQAPLKRSAARRLEEADARRALTHRTGSGM